MVKNDEEELSDADTLRTPENVISPDPRMADGACVEQRDFRSLGLEKIYADVRSLELPDMVPKSVKINFETAKNLYLYSFFVYRFGMVAKWHTFNSIELALNKRAIAEPYFNLENVTLPKLMRWAIKRRLIFDRDIGLFVEEHKSMLYQNYITDLMRRTTSAGEAYIEKTRDDLINESPLQDTQERINAYVNYARSIRNYLSHGYDILWPPHHVVSDLELACDFITAIFTREIQFDDDH